jgi:hypothetical protein
MIYKRGRNRKEKLMSNKEYYEYVKQFNQLVSEKKIKEAEALLQQKQFQDRNLNQGEVDVLVCGFKKIQIEKAV